MLSPKRGAKAMNPWTFRECGAVQVRASDQLLAPGLDFFVEVNASRLGL